MFEYSTDSGVAVVLPPIRPTFGELRTIRKLSEFDQFATMVEKHVTDEDQLAQLDKVSGDEVYALREAWFKHSQGLTLGE